MSPETRWTQDKGPKDADDALTSWVFQKRGDTPHSAGEWVSLAWLDPVKGGRWRALGLVLGEPELHNNVFRSLATAKREVEQRVRAHWARAALIGER
jgi:hypothetical protein